MSNAYDNKRYKRQYAKAVDVKLKRNSKAKISAKVAEYSGKCERLGCQSFDVKALIFSYRKNTYKMLCDEHAVKYISAARKKLKFKDAIECYEFGKRCGSARVLPENHFMPIQFYMGFRYGYHGEDYERLKFPRDFEKIELDYRSDFVW
jgi:hypothetical protein